MKIFTYWQQSKLSPIIPPYILCGIASMSRAFGDDFLLLGEDLLTTHLDTHFSSKRFYFAATADKLKNDISSITARSDYIRFKYMERNGGIWLDADTIVLKSFLPVLGPLLKTGKLLWHSEQFFAALPGNELVTAAVNNMETMDRQLYANPGNIKGLLPNNPELVEYLPYTLVDPTGIGSYSAKNWQIGVGRTVAINDFLVNPSCHIVKMYNSVTSSIDAGSMSVAEFLDSNILIANIFLSLENREYWITAAERLVPQMSSR